MNLHVVGAGPSGLLLARSCLDLFDEVSIYEEHSTVGEPEHCTGLVSRKILELVPEAQRVVIGSYREIIVVDERLRQVAELKLKEPAVLLNRKMFEQELARYLESRGNVRLLLRERASVYLDREVPVIVTSRRSVRCSDSVVAVCEGSAQRISRQILRYQSRDYVYGLQCDAVLRKSLGDSSSIIVILSTRFSNRYFAWMIPISEREVRLGVGYSRGPGTAYLARLSRAVKVSKLRRVFGGKILLSKPPRMLGVGRLVFVGDSVSQVKPLTGGGLMLITLTTILLSRLMHILLETRDVNVLGQVYSRVWHLAYGHYVKKMHRFREVLYSDVVSRVLSMNILPISLRFSISDFDVQPRYLAGLKLPSYAHDLSHLFK